MEKVNHQIILCWFVSFFNTRGENPKVSQLSSIGSLDHWGSTLLEDGHVR